MKRWSTVVIAAIALVAGGSAAIGEAGEPAREKTARENEGLLRGLLLKGYQFRNIEQRQDEDVSSGKTWACGEASMDGEDPWMPFHIDPDSRQFTMLPHRRLTQSFAEETERECKAVSKSAQSASEVDDAIRICSIAYLASEAVVEQNTFKLRHLALCPTRG